MGDLGRQFAQYVSAPSAVPWGVGDLIMFNQCDEKARNA